MLKYILKLSHLMNRSVILLLINLIFVSVLYSLKESYEEALRRDDVKAIVITGKYEELRSSPFFSRQWLPLR